MILKMYLKIGLMKFFRKYSFINRLVNAINIENLMFMAFLLSNFIRIIIINNNSKLG